MIHVSFFVVFLEFLFFCWVAQKFQTQILNMFKIRQDHSRWYSRNFYVYSSWQCTEYLIPQSESPQTSAMFLDPRHPQWPWSIRAKQLMLSRPLDASGASALAAVEISWNGRVCAQSRRPGIKLENPGPLSIGHPSMGN